MERKLTFLELLQMASKCEQPDEIYYNGKTYKWNGSDYVSNRKDIGEEICNTFTVCGLFGQKVIRVNDSVLDDREKRYIREALVPLGTIRVKKVSCDVVENLHYEYASKQSGREVENTLPFFKKGTMYKGMEPGQWYTVEELLEEK